MQKRFLKNETEGLILAAQDQALRTNAIKAKIDKSQTDSGCRLCKKVDEAISHLVSECEKLAQKEYKRRRDKVALALHWDLCITYDFKCGSKWYEHVPEGVLESADVKILWDFTIQTDRRPGMLPPDIYPRIITLAHQSPGQLPTGYLPPGYLPPGNAPPEQIPSRKITPRTFTPEDNYPPKNFNFFINYYPQGVY